MRSLISLQRPSSVGIRPVIKLIERLISRSLLVYRSINLSKKVLTGQLVLVQVEDRQVSEEAEFRGNVACAARRSLLDVGTLDFVYQAGQDKHKVDVPLSSLRERSTQHIALQRPSSVGI